MKLKRILFQGTRFEFSTHQDSSEINKFILAESNEKGFVFQIICISGYHSGAICGYVKEDDLLKSDYKGITKEHLIQEVNRNFMDVNEKSIKIFPE